MADPATILERMRKANPARSLEQIAVDDLDLVRDLVTRGRTGEAAPPEVRRVRGVRSRHRWRMRPALVAGLAAIVVLALVGVPLLVFTSGGNGEVTQSPTSLAPLEVQPPIGAFRSEWTSVSTDEAVFGPGTVLSVITIPEGFLAVGEICALGECRAAIWRSTDGVDWARVFVDPVGDPGASPDGTWFHDVAVHELGYLAVGSSYHVWVNVPVFAWSVDGVTWNRIQPLPVEQPPAQNAEGILLDTPAPLSVVAADDAFLVAGQSCEHIGFQEYECRGVIWRSEDGLTWTTVLEDVRDSAFESIERVADRFLAVGGAGAHHDLSERRGERSVDRQTIGDGVVRIWSSDDGITWADVSSDDSVFGAQRPDPRGSEFARAVTAVEAGFIIAGSQLDVDEGVIWYSADGSSWTRLPANEVFGGAAINGIVGSGDRLIAVGAMGTTAAAWRSDDGGSTWERMNIDPVLTRGNSRFLDVVVRGDMALAGLAVEGRAAIWAIDLSG